jgi:vitamin K-dependent gamma-carboxylase-like protein/methylamine utilization protein MauE
VLDEHHTLTVTALRGSAPSHIDPSLRCLAWARIALGTLFLVRTTPLCELLRFPFETSVWPLLGWPDGRWIGQGWLHLPDGVTAAACVARTAAAGCFLAGLRTRWSGLVAGALGYLVMLQNPFGAAFTLHLLFQGAMILALADAGCALAWRPEPPRAPRSSVLLVRSFLASIYLWAGIAKLRPDWLDGRTLALFQADGAFHGWASRAVLSACATTVVVIELALPVLLLWPRTRRFGLALAFALHAAIELAARPDLLGWEMAALLLALWPVRDGQAMGEERRVYSHESEAAGQPMKP